MDYNERTRVMGYRSFFVNCGAFILPWMYWFTERSWFDTPLQGMRCLSVISGVIFILFALYFYYMIGLGLENQWGKVRFNLYYGVGMLGSIIAALITGYGSNMFLNLSLFFAYAALYPDEQVLLFMFLPIKMKYLALADAALYLYYFIVGGASTRVTIVLCLLNVFLFLGGDIINTIRRESRYWKTRYNFRKAMRK